MRAARNESSDYMSADEAVGSCDERGLNCHREGAQASPTRDTIALAAARPETTTPTLSPLTFTTGELYANPAATQHSVTSAAQK